MTHCIRTLISEEGPRSLFQGLSPGVQRQCIFAGLRIGLYPGVRDFFVGRERVKQGAEPNLIQRIMAGLVTGAFGITVACPTDVVKIRLQAEGKLEPGVPRRYKGSFDAYKKIIASDGFVGLYSGLLPNILRNSIMNAAELASYDQIKTSLIKTFKSVDADSIMLHFACGLSAGFIAVCFASPVDVIKTRVMNNPDKYGGALSCFLKTLKVEGPMAFYGGFFANFCRVGTWNILMFLTLEQCQIFVRNNYL